MFSSERVYLRKMEKNDTEQYHTWRMDMDVMNSTSLFLDTYTYKETSDFVEIRMLDSNSSKSYIIMERAQQLPIGVTSLINLDLKNRNAECIIDIGEKNYWGKGYGKEALQLLLTYAFNELNLHRVSLQVFSFNTRAIQLYEKLGFVEEGKCREALYRNGEWHDIIQMGLLKKEFSQA
ncbi:GNAT family N-acetyltransferase [Virgibacillus halodenitrificans]|uniref:GNAT family N-acetyltransferase n=1 Tax=Virgibacillus halodenitrificans TaxID=1482 RepID=UPI000EF5455B|nr:GNAT family protein [Virgibacillus halodenitrificans]MYL44250.1 GNAT family N-acetyltransferase [Virgibacillus halodenitrificans]